LNFRVGLGYDVHRLVDGHPFWLGGIRIEHHSGAFGHSDADVLIHAICDALLGAANLGDIGQHFPDTSAEFKNIDSKILLDRVKKLLQTEGYRIGNIDTMLLLERPKVKAYIPEMRKTLCAVLQIEEHQLSIKATTNEKMGFVGRQEGLAAHAIALIFKD
jgi:2-C-methyl-D-erythritol 2,4-cyclodiphosphate synthase